MAIGHVRSSESQSHGAKWSHEWGRMQSIEKALWFIEYRFSNEITLEDVARSIGVSSHITTSHGPLGPRQACRLCVMRAGDG
jgi:hypothetical protein